MNWLKKMFGKNPKPKVIDSNDLMVQPYTMYINTLGVLIINSPTVYGNVVAICEWSNNSKFINQIDESTVVLDIKVQTIIIHKH